MQKRCVRAIVAVRREYPNGDDAAAFSEAVPDADVVVSSDLEATNDVYDERPAQLLMVDRQAIVAAGIEDSDLPDVVDGMAVWIRELLDDWLERRDEGRPADE